MDCALSERVEQACRENAGKTALFEHGEVPVSYSSFFLSVLSFAETLQRRGVKAGDLVANFIREPISFLALKLALLRLGATSVGLPIERAYGDREIEIDWLLVPKELSTRNAREIVFTNAWIRPPDRYTPIASGALLVHTTSGTTGMPKLRAETETSLLARVENGLRWYGGINGPTYLGFNIATLVGFKTFLGALISGHPQMFFLDGPEKTLTALVRNKVEHAYLPPFRFREMLDVAVAKGIETPHLKRVNLGGGGISPAFAQRAEDVLGCEVYTGYGSTETDRIAFHRPGLFPDKVGVVGRIFPELQFRFTETDGLDGELWVRPPDQIRTFSFPDMQRLCDADGWISTGDVGRIDADGFLVLVGRKSEFLNLGGNKLAPSRFEALVAPFPGIREVTAFRVPTSSGVDDLGLAIVVEPAFDRRAFEAFLGQELENTCLFHVHVLDQIPLTKAGKTDRNALTRKFGFPK